MTDDGSRTKRVRGRELQAPVDSRPRASTLVLLDSARHRIPFWWWLTYDALVLLVIVVGVPALTFAWWLGLAVLAIAVAIDTVEFLVKRPTARAQLDEIQP